jgi:alpha-N-acetylglucosaminidase
MRKSCYQKLEPHPQLGWQIGKCGPGSVNRDTAFFKATELFLSCRKQLAKSDNYKADAIERAAITLGLKADDWFKAAADAYKIKDTLKGNNAGKRGLELLTELDRLMESHPLNRLERWIGFARSHSQDPKLQQFYESNARQIVTIWGPPVNDYSCRIWSGLVRDYYRERMAKILTSLKTGIRFNRKQWEQDWVNGSGVSPVTPYADPVATAQLLVTKALNEKIIR